jgi:hypothetical protein
MDAPQVSAGLDVKPFPQFGEPFRVSPAWGFGPIPRTERQGPFIYSHAVNIAKLTESLRET